MTYLRHFPDRDTDRLHITLPDGQRTTLALDSSVSDLARYLWKGEAVQVLSRIALDLRMSKNPGKASLSRRLTRHVCTEAMRRLEKSENQKNQNQ